MGLQVSPPNGMGLGIGVFVQGSRPYEKSENTLNPEKQAPIPAADSCDYSALAESALQTQCQGHEGAGCPAASPNCACFPRWSHAQLCLLSGTFGTLQHWQNGRIRLDSQSSPTLTGQQQCKEGQAASPCHCSPTMQHAKTELNNLQPGIELHAWAAPLARVQAAVLCNLPEHRSCATGS